MGDNADDGDSVTADFQEAYKGFNIIMDMLGTFGHYQRFCTILIFLTQLASAWLHMNHVFFSYKNNYVCVEPANASACSPDCKKAIFDQSTIKESILMSFNLVCSRQWLIKFSQRIHILGYMIGALLFGIIADTWGRRLPLIISSLAETVFGLTTAFSIDHDIYITLRFLTGIAIGAQMNVSYIMLIEILYPGHDILATALFNLGFNVAFITLPLAAFLARSWRYNQMMFSIFSSISILFICGLLESPRWCFAVGRLDKAVKITEFIALRNKSKAENIRHEIIKQYEIAAPSTLHFTHLFRIPFLRAKLFVSIYLWFSACILYRGAMAYIFILAENVFLCMTISGIIAVPGTVICLTLAKNWGRGVLLIRSNMVSSLGFLFIAVFHNLSERMMIFCATVGLFGAYVIITLVYLYVGEIFPTALRCSAFGVCSAFAITGSIAVTFIYNYLIELSPTLPPMAFVLFSILGFILAFLMPETKRSQLPDTVYDAELICKQNANV